MEPPPRANQGPQHAGPKPPPQTEHEGQEDQGGRGSQQTSTPPEPQGPQTGASANSPQPAGWSCTMNWAAHAPRNLRILTQTKKPQRCNRGLRRPEAGVCKLSTTWSPRTNRGQQHRGTQSPAPRQNMRAKRTKGGGEAQSADKHSPLNPRGLKLGPQQTALNSKAVHAP